MTINYTTLLGLAKPVTGTESGTWGDVVNDQITSLVEDAIANAASLNVTSGNVTLTDNNGSSDQARMAILLVTGTPGVSRNIVAPSTSKWYIVKNGSNAEVVLKGSATTGVTIPAGVEALAFWNGSDFELVSMVGPSSSTDNAITRYDGTTGKVVQNSGVTIDDSNNMTGVVALTATGNINFDGGTFVFNDSGADKDFRVEGDTDANLLFTDASTDRVGIGTSSPGAKLNVEVTGSGNFTSLLLSRTTGSIDQEQSIVWQQNDLSNLAGAAIAGSFESATSGSLRFKTTLSSSLTERMRLDPSGNLGIGVTPSAWSGAVPRALQFGSNAAVNAGAALYLTCNGFYNGTNWIYQNTDLASYYIQNVGNHQWFSAASGTAGNTISFSERMRLDSSGNLGLGVTPSAWSVIKAIQIGSTAGSSIYADNGSTIAGVASNAYYSSTGWKYFGTALASRYEQSIGAHQWFTAPSGTANNAITFTQAMTLDASGRLGINVTSVEERLHVASANPTNGVIQFIQNTSTSAQTGALIKLDVGNVGTSALGIPGGTSNALAFYVGGVTSGSERARITSGGYFKASNNGTYAGSTSSYHEFYSSTNSNFAAYITQAAATSPSGIVIQYTGAAPNGAGNYFVYCQDTAALRAGILSNGGLSNYQANDVNLSDRREKTNFAPAKSYLDTICAIPVQTFNYIDQAEDDPGLTLGVIAQDVQAVAPELVTESNWGTQDDPKMRLSIYQTDLQYALMKCIQELKTELDSVKAELAALKGA